MKQMIGMRAGDVCGRVIRMIEHGAQVGQEEIKDLGDERQYKSHRIDANFVWVKLKNFGVGI